MSLPARLQASKGADAPRLIVRSREAQWRPCRLKAKAALGCGGLARRLRRNWEGALIVGRYLKELQTKKGGGKKKNMTHK